MIEMIEMIVTIAMAEAIEIGEITSDQSLRSTIDGSTRLARRAGR
jgi:hypothetical protein